MSADMSSYLAFDSIECSDAVERFGCDRRRMNFVDIMKLTSRMRHTCGFLNVACSIQMSKTSIGIRL